MNALKEEISRFRNWALSTGYPYGEWEFYYEGWDTLYAAVFEAIDKCLGTEIPPDLAEDLLYVLARDNECEAVLEHLVQRPSVLAQLAGLALAGAEKDAKWQIVAALGEAQLPHSADLIRPFLHDSDEYVRRRALLAYASWAPREAEEIALKNLSDEFEYTRIAALHVLHAVESSHLDASLTALENDPSEHVRCYVRELRS